VKIKWTAFPLHPETPFQGRSLEDLFAGRGMDIAKMLAHLKQTANQLSLPFGPRTMTYNSRRAQELGKWAEAHGRGDAYHLKTFQAYFVDGKNIAELQVLRELAIAVGLNGENALKALKRGDYKDAVDKDWRRSKQMGIHAVPTFQINSRMLVGAQTYEALSGLVNGAAF
jgi:predicted DsbA family dithiol-disulfide isomerase